jgi:hypothetical protein
MNTVASFAGRARRMRALALLVFGVLILASGAASAQSGRRVPKRPDPEPTLGTLPTPLPEAGTADSPLPDARPKTEVRVAHFIMDFNVPSYGPRVVLDSCIKELKASGLFDVSAASELNRKEAIEDAKAGAKHVCWLQFTIDSLDPTSRVGSVRALNLVADFSVFAPQTGKSMAYGRAYFQTGRTIMGSGGTIPGIPGGRTSGYGTAEQAGRQIASQIIRAFATPPVPPTRRP